MRPPLGSSVSLALLLCGLGAAAPAFGQTSNLPPGAPRIEMYSGTRRIPEARVRPATPAPAPRPTPAPVTRSAPKFMPSLHDGPPLPAEPIVLQPPATPAELPPMLKQEDRAVLPASATSPVVAIPATPQAPKVAPIAAPASAALTAAAVDRPHLGDWLAAVPWLRGTLGQMLVLLGALVVILLMLSAIFLTLLKWFGPVLRVEFVNRGGAFPLLVPQAAPATILDAIPVEDESIAPNFELGPTYAEEQAMKAETEKQQEQAVLQQVFEQNLQVLEEIDRMYGPFLAPENEATAPQEPAAAG